MQYQAFYCLAAADRYAIEASGAQLLDVQQQVAAQYVMLMSEEGLRKRSAVALLHSIWRRAR
jgi:hypothetical protein